jgi:hypothetical protein
MVVLEEQVSDQKERTTASSFVVAEPGSFSSYFLKGTEKRLQIMLMVLLEGNFVVKNLAACCSEEGPVIDPRGHPQKPHLKD